MRVFRPNVNMWRDENRHFYPYLSVPTHTIQAKTEISDLVVTNWKNKDNNQDHTKSGRASGRREGQRTPQFFVIWLTTIKRIEFQISFLRGQLQTERVNTKSVESSEREDKI